MSRPDSRGARVRSVIARLVWALVVLGLTGVVVAAATLRPAARPTAVPATRVQVPAATTELVCAGPVRLPTEPEPGGDVAYDPQFDPSPQESVTALRALTVRGAPEEDAAPGTLETVAGDLVAELEPSGDAGVAETDEVTGSLVLRADPTDQVPAWAAGVVSVLTTGGDLRGLVAAPCQLPAARSWLVGGSTVLGSSARLVLQNPGRTPATVTVRIWGPSGPVELAGAPDYLVPPRSELVVLLEGVAAEQQRIVVQTVASGGLVTAYLQDSQLRGLLPAGVDYVVAGRAPATRQVLTGLSVTDTPVEGADTSVLRLLVPGEEAGTVDVTFLGADGEVTLPGTSGLDLDAGAVLDVPLGGLPAGAYTVVVDAQVPVVAGALLTRGAGVGGPDVGTLATSPLDRAWVPTAGLGGSGPLALPDGARGQLLLGTVPGAPGGTADEPTGAASVTLEVVGTDGEVLDERHVEVARATTTAILLAQLLPAEAPDAEVAGVVVRTDDPRVAWAVVLVAPDPAGDLVSVLSPVAPPQSRPYVDVRLR